MSSLSILYQRYDDQLCLRCRSYMVGVAMLAASPSSLGNPIDVKLRCNPGSHAGTGWICKQPTWGRHFPIQVVDRETLHTNRTILRESTSSQHARQKVILPKHGRRCLKCHKCMQRYLHGLRTAQCSLCCWCSLTSIFHLHVVHFQVTGIIILTSAPE